MTRIGGFLRRLDSVFELPSYDGTPVFVEDACAHSEDNGMPSDQIFARHICDLSVRTSPSYVAHAADRAHVLRFACSHLFGILDSKALSRSVTKHLDCLSVIAIAMEGRQEKDWDDAEQLRLSSQRTIDELSEDGLTMEEILGNDVLEKELRTLHDFATSKLDSHSVWKAMAKIVRTYLAAAKAYCYYLYLEDLQGTNLRQHDVGLQLASRFDITDWEVLREDLRTFMNKCKTLAYLDRSCLPDGLNLDRQRGIVCAMLRGFSGCIHLGNGALIRVQAGKASVANITMRTEETGIMMHALELTFHVDGPNETRIAKGTWPALAGLFQRHIHDIDCGDWFVDGTRIKQRVRADVRRHAGGYRDIVVSVNNRKSDVIVLFMVQFLECEDEYVVEFGFQDPLGSRRNVVRWPSRSFLELWMSAYAS